jgi:hypothetical protein
MLDRSELARVKRVEFGKTVYSGEMECSLKMPNCLSFAFLLVLFLWTSPSVQAQIDPACKIEGPSVTETVTYISNALAESAPYIARSGELWKEQISVSSDSTKIQIERFRLIQGVQSKSHDWVTMDTIPVEAGECGGQLDRLQGAMTLKSVCKSSKQCVTMTRRSRVTAGSQQDFTIQEDSSIIELNMPADQADRMSRAFSHLIDLTQKQYNEKHADTDPFSK